MSIRYGHTKRRYLLNQTGLGIVEVLVAGTIAALVIVAVMQALGFLNKTAQTQRQKGDIANLMEQRLGYIKNIIHDQLGTTTYLRKYATSTQDESAFNPILDTDPNTTFAGAFGVSGTPPSEPQVSYQGASFNLTYTITLNTRSFDPAQGKFILTPITFPNATVTLNQVSTIVVNVQAFNADAPQVRRQSAVIIAVP